MQTNHTRMARQPRKYLLKMLPKHSINANKLQQITVEWQGNLETIFCKCFADIPPMEMEKSSQVRKQTLPLERVK